jgi:hypothetical protein
MPRPKGARGGRLPPPGPRGPAPRSAGAPPALSPPPPPAAAAAAAVVVVVAPQHRVAVELLEVKLLGQHYLGRAAAAEAAAAAPPPRGAARHAVAGAWAAAAGGGGAAERGLDVEKAGEEVCGGVAAARARERLEPPRGAAEGEAEVVDSAGGGRGESLTEGRERQGTPRTSGRACARATPHGRQAARPSADKRHATGTTAAYKPQTRLYVPALTSRPVSGSSTISRSRAPPPPPPPPPPSGPSSKLPEADS